MDTSNAFGTPLDESSDPTETPISQAPAPAEAPAPPVTAESGSSLMDKVGEFGADALKGIAHGAESAVRGIRTNVRAVGAPIADALGLDEQAKLMREPLEYGTDKPETLAGEVTAGLTEAGLSWVAGGAIAKGAGLAIKGTTAIGAALQTGIGSLATTDPNHERLSNVLSQYPVVGPAFDLLAQKPTDNGFIAKAKSLIEESFTAGAATKVFNAVHLLALKVKGAPPATVAAAEEKVIAGVAPEAAEAAPKVAPTAETGAKTALPPITILRPSGEPIVTLTEAASVRFQNLQDKLVIQDMMGRVPTPKQGLDASAAKEGVPLRPPLRDSPNVVLQGLADLGKFTKDQLGSGVETEEMTRAGADILGNTPELAMAKLRSLNVSLEDGGAIMVGVAQLMQSQGKVMMGLARKALLGDMDARELHKKVYVGLSGVQAEYAQTQTLLGRALHSIGYKTKPFDQAALMAKLSTPEDAVRIERLMVAADGDANKVAAIIQLQNMSWVNKAVGVHNEYWTGLGLLSRFSTQVINGLSTGINSMATPASMITGGLVQGAAGKGFDSVRLGIGLYAGMRSAFFDSVHMSWQAFKSGEAIISQAGTNEVKLPFISSMAFNMNPDHFHAKLIDYFGEGVRLSFSGLTAGDEFWKQINYRSFIASKAGMEAADLVKAGKLAKDQIHKHVSDAMQSSIDDQRRGIVPEALKYAEKTSFVNDLKIPTIGGMPSVGELAARAASHPIIRGVLLPFVKTPTNVTRTTFEYTPIIGQMRKAFYTDVQAGGHVAAEAIGKLTMGAGFYLGAAHLALEGRITGAPPAAGVFRPPGWQPYSVKFEGMGRDGGDLYLSYQRLQPFGDILGLTTDFAQSAGMLDPDTRDGLANSMTLALSKFLGASTSEQGQMIGNGAVGAAASFGKSIISKTYFRNMTEFFSTFSGYNNEDKVARWFQNYTASHVPGALSQFNDDETMREVRSTMDAIMARIPGISQLLPARRDYVGRVNDTKIGMPYSVISPMSARSTKPDEVFTELQRLSDSSAEASFSEPAKSTLVNGHQVDLKTIKNDQGETAYDRMNDLMQTIKPRGESKTFHEKLAEVIHDPQYKLGVNEGREATILDASPDIPGYRVKAIKAEEMKYRAAALEHVKNEFKTQLGIDSAQKDAVKTKIARTKVGAGIYDKLLELGK